MKNLFAFFLICLVLIGGSNEFFPIVGKTIGKGYCAIRHPVESLTSERASCESQHVIQQNSGGMHELNTIWINTVQHSYLDRSSCKPWEEKRPSRFVSTISDINMERAYMTGVWAKGYHFFVYDHHGPGRWNVIEWDGATHIVYALSTIINFPQKEINYFSYQIERYRKGQSTQFIDASLGVFFDLAEVTAGMANSMIGVLVGTVLNPLDTVRNLIPLLTMSIGSIVNSVTEFFKGVISLVTLGSYGACGTI